MHVTTPQSKPAASLSWIIAKATYPGCLLLPLSLMQSPLLNTEAWMRLLQLRQILSSAAQTVVAPISFRVTAATCHASSLLYQEFALAIPSLGSLSSSIHVTHSLSSFNLSSNTTFLVSPSLARPLKIATGTHTSYYLSRLSSSPWPLSPPDLVHTQMIYSV